MLEEFELKPIESSADCYKPLAWLIKRKDVDEPINACDATASGNTATSWTPPRRRSCQAPGTQRVDDAGAILDAFHKLRTDDECSRWRTRRSAAARATGSWHQRHARADGAELQARRFRLTSGCAQRRRRFHSGEEGARDRRLAADLFYEYIALAEGRPGSIRAAGLDEPFKKDENDEHKKAEAHLGPGRSLPVRSGGCHVSGKPVSSSRRRSLRQAALCSTTWTSLQRGKASNRFGFSALARRRSQALKEKFKVLTYPAYGFPPSAEGLSAHSHRHAEDLRQPR
ncbi:MAG: hypothetical protein R3F13_19525 [Prosthecobacter sp.]